MNSKLLKRKTEKHEIQMLSCGVGLDIPRFWIIVHSWRQIDMMQPVECKQANSRDLQEDYFRDQEHEAL